MRSLNWLPRTTRTSLPVVLVALALSLAIASATANAKKFKVVTTFTVLADMATNVAGDAAIVVSITKPGAEIHNYQPTPRDIVKALGADLILWNGLGLELWFKKFLVNLRDVPSVVLTDGITPMGIHQGPYAGKPNPHAWMSPRDALIYVANIAKALATYDPANAAIYQANAASYAKRITATAAPMRKALSTIPNAQKWLVTSEGAFSYLARDFGLQELYLWPINADAQGTPQQVRKVIDTVRRYNIRAVFSESTVSPNPAKQVAYETGARYGGVLYVDSLSRRSGPVPTYLDLLQATNATIIKGIR